MSSTSIPREATSVATSVSRLAALEVGERATALALGLVAVHGHRPDLLVTELLDEAVGAALGADEDQGAAALCVAELLDERVHLGLVGQMDEAVLDVDALLPLRLVDVAPRVAGVGGGELAGRPLERRREEQGLAIAGHLRHDPVDRGLEADVEHAVGLVEDEDRDPLQIEGASLQLILEAARCRDHDVGVGGLLGLPVECRRRRRRQRP